MKQTVSILPDLESLSSAAAARVAQISIESVATNGRCTIALAGGKTPQRLYEMLRERLFEQIPWDHVHFFWGDERFVTHDSPESNYGMATRALLDHVGIRRQNIHPVDTDLPSADAAAQAYDKELREFFGPTIPSFDILMLGIGSDGHVASLFPSTLLNEVASTDGSRFAIHTQSSVAPLDRISITLPVINNAAHVLLLACGAEKKAIVRRIFLEKQSMEGLRLPAARVTARIELEYFLDELAADRNVETSQ